MNDHRTDQPHDRDLTSPVDVALARALARAGEELGEVPADVARTHIDAITVLATTHAHRAPAPAAGWRMRVRRVAGLTVVKVALGAGVAAAATTGGLAATGNLPDSVQQVVSDGARRVGIQIPQPSVPSSAEDEVVHEPQDQEKVDVPPTAPATPSSRLGDPGPDVDDVPDRPLRDHSAQTDPPADPDPGPLPVGPSENDPSPTPRQRPRPEPVPERHRPTPTPEGSPTPRAPAGAPAAPASDAASDHGDGADPHGASGGDPSGDAAGGRAPAAG